MLKPWSDENEVDNKITSELYGMGNSDGAIINMRMKKKMMATHNSLFRLRMRKIDKIINVGNISGMAYSTLLPGFLLVLLFPWVYLFAVSYYIYVYI
jgi:hypothetical protein